MLVPRRTPLAQPPEPLQPRQPKEVLNDLDLIDDSSGWNSSVQLMRLSQGSLSLSRALSAPIDNPVLVGQVRQKTHTTVEEATETETGSELSREKEPLLLTVKELSTRLQVLERIVEKRNY